MARRFTSSFTQQEALSADPTVLPNLLDQVDGPVDLYLADCAYDGE